MLHQLPVSTVLAPQVLLIGAIITVLVFLGFKTIYNLWFHPLARFPGPLLGRITDWYLVFVICSVPTYGLELHKKYGPIIRLAPNKLSFSDPTLLPIVYNHTTDKPEFYGSWMFGYTAAMFQSLKHSDHYAKKRLVAPCCSMSAMKAHHESKISERVDELCEKLRERSAVPDRPVDFSEHLRWFLSDTWSHIAYGEPKGWVAQGRDVDGLLAALQGVYSMSAYAAVMPWLMPFLRHPWWRKNVWSWTRTFRNMAKLFHNFDTMTSRSRCDEKLKNETLFFDNLGTSKNPNDFEFSREDLLAETITFTAATLDGVAALIAPLINNLLSHPQAYARVTEEIVAAERAGQLSRPVVTYEETTRLPFFSACIKETLRCDAPAQTILPRIVGAPGYALYGGAVHVPGGAEMGASPYIIHRDEATFGPEPDAWRPERWVAGSAARGAVEMTPGEHEAYVRRMEKFGMWWGYGDRECAGKYYAVMEMQKLCVELIRRFEMETPRSAGGFRHERWAVGMFWGQQLKFKQRR